MENLSTDKILDTTRQFVSFLMGEELYGINIFNTQEIIRIPEITPIPNSKEYIEGIINLRGDVIPVINLGSKFQISSDNRHKREIIIVRSKGVKIGILVNRVFRVVQIDEQNISPPPSVLSGIEEDYITGVSRIEDNRLVILINVEVLLFSTKKDMENHE